MAPPAALAEVERAFFRCSTTIGVRRYAVARTVLARSLVDVDTAYGPVRVKVGAVDGEVIGAQPEFEDCRRRAAATGVAGARGDERRRRRRAARCCPSRRAARTLQSQATRRSAR